VVKKRLIKNKSKKKSLKKNLNRIYKMSNLFNYDVNLQPAVMDIRSETLEPISSATNRFVFRLDQAGELDANSVLLFKAVGNDASLDNKLRVNPYGGGLLAIKRATFQVGDYVLNDVSDIGKIASLVDLGAVNKASQSKYNSHYFQNNFHTEVLSSAGSGDGLTTLTQFGGAGSIVYDRHRSAFDFGEPNNSNTNSRVNNCIITRDSSTSHQIGIPLGNIFPCLKGQTIPLFLFQEYRILLTIEFHDCSLWVNDITDGSMTCASGKVAPADVKLQVDYIIYPSEVQNAMRQQTAQQGGLNLVFPDIIKVEKQIPAATADSEQKVEHRLGMDNKEVHKIYMCKQIDRAGTPNYLDRILLNARCDGMNQEEYNVNIDGVDVFVEPKFSPSSQYDETSYCLGGDLAVPRPMYFNDENTIMSRLADSQGGLLGKMKPLCLDLDNGSAGYLGSGRQIGAYPIIWKYKRRPCGNTVSKSSHSPADQYIQADLSGALNVDYFVYCSRTATIMSTPSGTMVNVAY